MSKSLASLKKGPSVRKIFHQWEELLVSLSFSVCVCVWTGLADRHQAPVARLQTPEHRYPAVRPAGRTRQLPWRRRRLPNLLPPCQTATSTLPLVSIFLLRCALQPTGNARSATLTTRRTASAKEATEVNAFLKPTCFILKK